MSDEKAVSIGGLDADEVSAVIEKVMDQMVSLFPQGLSPLEYRLRGLALAGRNYFEVLTHTGEAGVGPAMISMIQDSLIDHALGFSRMLIEEMNKKTTEEMNGSRNRTATND